MKIKDLLKYRNIWLGFAMMAIVWYHFKLDLPIGPLRRFKDIAYYGVDICLFASGAGCYLSLKNDGRLSSFFRKRFFRLMPTYWVFIVFWIIFRMLCNPITLWAALGNFLGLQYPSAQGMHFNWYISGIMILYLLSPGFVKLVDAGKNMWQQLLIFLLLFAATALFWNRDTFIVIAVRVPIYYAGMLLGRLSREGRSVSALPVFLLISVAILGGLLGFLVIDRYEALSWSYGLAWYPAFLVTPGACVILSLFSAKLERFYAGRLVLAGINKLGEYSFEIYLVHLGLFELFVYAINTLGLPGSNLTWCVALILTALLCLLLRRASLKLEKLLGRTPLAIT